MGNKKLAYQINKKKEGFYVVVPFKVALSYLRSLTEDSRFLMRL